MLRVDPAPVRAAVSRAMLDWMLGTAAAATARIDQGPGGFRSDRGEVKRSIDTRAPEASGDVIEGAIVATAPHALYVHEGRSPGKRPPISAILPWVERKLGLAGSEARSVAFLVARKVGRRGVSATPFLRDPAAERLPLLGPAVGQAYADALAAQIPPTTL